MLPHVIPEQCVIHDDFNKLHRFRF